MGHIRLGRLPATRKWQQVVALLSEGAPFEQIAAASAEAAESSLRHARDDPTLSGAYWLLTQIPLAARSGDFAAALRALGLQTSDTPTVLEVGAALAEAIDRQSSRAGGRTDLGELAQHAAVLSLPSERLSYLKINVFFRVQLCMCKSLCKAPDHRRPRHPP